MSRKKFLTWKYQFYKREYDYLMFIFFWFHTVFFGTLIFRGRKLAAFNRFLNMKHYIKRLSNLDPFFLIMVVLLKLIPKVVLVSLRIGKTLQMVPMHISEKKQVSFVIR